MPLLRPLMEMLHRPAQIALPIKRHDARHLGGPDPARTRLAEPPVEHTILPVGLKPPPQPTKRPLAHSQRDSVLKVLQKL
jgi:hypothetical protein